MDKFDILTLIFQKRTFLSNIYFNLFYSWLPIKKNKIVFLNFLDGGYGCNPKYIAQELINQNIPLDIVWIVKPELHDKKEFPPQVRLVDFYDNKKCLKELSTAKIWINNTYMVRYINKGLHKKKGQFYINTWHGSLGIKKIGFDVPKYALNPVWREPVLKDAKMMDVMLSNCEFEDNVYKSAMKFTKRIERTGHPRNDILINGTQELKNKILNSIGLNGSKKIALYAPSFRDNLVTECYNLNFKRLKEALENKTGEKWEIITHFHHAIWYKLKYLNELSEYQHDVTLYPDIQELLFVSDILISDYSSCMFDFMLKKAPVFVYATDIERYNTDRGFYFPLEETPFPIARNNDELIQNINNFNQEKYINECTEFLGKRNITEDGQASKRAVEIIKENLEKV